MSPNELFELRQSLRAQGYSRRYIRRLVQELVDHTHCVLAESKQKQPSGSELNQRIGHADEVVDAVLGRTELQPLPRRFPVWTFWCIPAMTLCMGTLLYLSLVQSLQGGHYDFGNWNRQIVELTVWSFKMMPIFVAGFACLLAKRYQLGWWLPVGTIFLMATGSLFEIEIAICRNSHSLVGTHRLGFDELQFASTFIIPITILIWNTLANTRRWNEKSISGEV